MGLNGLEWVLLGFTGFYWVLLGFYGRIRGGTGNEIRRAGGQARRPSARPSAPAETGRGRIDGAAGGASSPTKKKHQISNSIFFLS